MRILFAATANCEDGIRNQNETGVDCGGPCDRDCCHDGIRNLDEEGVDGEVVGLLLYRYECRNPVCIVVELLDVGFAVFGSLLHLENALTRFLLIWCLFSFIAICRFRRETSLCGLLHS